MQSRVSNPLNCQYSLSGIVCWIDEPRIEGKHGDKRHLVAAIKVPSEYLKPNDKLNHVIPLTKPLILLVSNNYVN